MSVFRAITGGVGNDYLAGTPIAGSFGFWAQDVPGSDDGEIGELLAGDADAVLDIIWIAEECPFNVGVDGPGFSVGDSSEFEVCE